jgi:two-component system OmpR family sensor kinase
VRQLDRLTRLATRLLQLARIESGVALKREPVDLTLLARLVADEFIDARGAGRLVVEIHGEPAPVAGDLDALGIALRNLIDNALKHAAGAARVTVRVGPGEIAVIDDGPGVPPASLGTLVRPFVRGEVASEGSGLGLAIVNTIALQSGARLELRSPVDHGHGFGATLRFDLAAGAGAAAAPPDGCLRAGGGEP